MEALSYSVFTISQTGASSVYGKTPAVLWFGRPISLKFLKSFGCECFVMIPDRECQKIDKKSRKGIFVGYDAEEHSYRIYFPIRRAVEVSFNIVFDEKVGPEKGYTEIDCNLTKDSESEIIYESDSEVESIGEDFQEESDESSDSDDQQEMNQEAIGSVNRCLRNLQNIKPHLK